MTSSIPMIFVVLIVIRLQALSRRHRQQRPAFGFPVALDGMIGTLEPAGSFFPIHNLPPARQIFATPVFMLQIVGVFPDIIQQQREMVLHQRIVVAGGGTDLESAAVALRSRQPDPTGPEEPGPPVVESCLELGHPPEITLDRVGKRTRGRAAATR